MTEQQRKVLLDKLVRHMLDRDVEWGKIIAIREAMWQDLGWYVKKLEEQT